MNQGFLSVPVLPASFPLGETGKPNAKCSLAMAMEKKNVLGDFHTDMKAISRHQHHSNPSLLLPFDPLRTQR